MVKFLVKGCVMLGKKCVICPSTGLKLSKLSISSDSLTIVDSSIITPVPYKENSHRKWIFVKGRHLCLPPCLFWTALFCNRTRMSRRFQIPWEGAGRTAYHIEDGLLHHFMGGRRMKSDEKTSQVTPYPCSGFGTLSLSIRRITVELRS